MPYMEMVHAWVATVRSRLRGDAGSPTLETVIIAAALAAVSIAATALIVTKVMDHASKVQ
jgi:hypothetical protein